VETENKVNLWSPPTRGSGSVQQRESLGEKNDLINREGRFAAGEGGTTHGSGPSNGRGWQTRVGLLEKGSSYREKEGGGS